MLITPFITCTWAVKPLYTIYLSFILILAVHMHA